MYQRLALVFVMILLLSAKAIGQNTISLKGTIVDAVTGETLIGVNIYLLSDLSKGITTDEMGNYELNLPKSDKKETLIYSYMGYIEASYEFMASQSAVHDVKLMPLTREMQGITITGERLMAEEFTVEELDQIEVYTNPLSKGDAILAVNALPSSTTTDESANVSLRGSSPAETGLFFNNVPIYDAVRFAQLNGIGTFSIFNTEIIRQVQVFPSNPPLEFGNTSSGMIALQTEGAIPAEHSHTISVNLGNIGATSTLKVAPNTGLTVFGNYQPSAALKWLNQEALEELKGFESVDLGVYMVSNLNEKTQVRLFNYSLSEGYDFLSEHPSGSVLYQQRRRRNFTIANVRRLLPNGELTLNLGSSFSKLALLGNNLDLDNRQRDLYASVNLSQYWGNYSHKTGITADTRQSVFSGRVPQYGFALRAEDPTLDASLEQRFAVLEAYYYGKFNLAEKWAVAAGVRKNLPVGEVPSYWSGQLNVHYQLNKKQWLNLSLGQYHRYNLADANAENPYLVSSRQLSLDYHLEVDQADFQASVFGKDTQLGELHNPVFGVELFARYQLGKRLQLQASYTYIEAALEDTGLKYPSSYDLDFFVKASASYRPSTTWSFGASWLYRQGSYYLPVESAFLNEEVGVYQPRYAGLDAAERLPNYSLINMNVSKIFLVKEAYTVILFGSINNLINRENIRAQAYSSDYSSSMPQLFSRRLLFLGGMLQF